jgi:beta-phosphoglucomutase-like phosphatase (HAD superfamily)
MRIVAEARAAGLRVAVATTTSPGNVEALAHALWQRPVAQVFDVIAAGDEVARKKPDPAVYLLALERLGVPPGAALAFEDSRNGVLAARAAGIAVVAAPSIHTEGDDLSEADLVLPDLDGYVLPTGRNMFL